MATAIEYGLIAALIAVAIINAVNLPGNTVSDPSLNTLNENGGGGTTDISMGVVTRDPSGSEIKWGNVLKDYQGNSFTFDGSSCLFVNDISNGNTFSANLTFKIDESIGVGTYCLISAMDTNSKGYELNIIKYLEVSIPAYKLEFTLGDGNTITMLDTTFDPTEANTVFIGRDNNGLAHLSKNDYLQSTSTSADYAPYSPASKEQISLFARTQSDPDRHFVGDAAEIQLFAGLDTTSNVVQNTASYLNESPWHLFNVTGATGGDPYIYPLLCNNQVIKLPDCEAYYRLFEQGNTFINAHVKQASTEHQQRMKDYVKASNVDEKALGIKAITDGYFYDSVYINSDDHIIHIDLHNHIIKSNDKTNTFFTLKKIPHIIKDGVFKQKCQRWTISWTNQENNRIDIEISLFPNPHYENGINLNVSNFKNTTGLFIRNYKPKFMRLPSLTITKYKTLHRRLRKTKRPFAQHFEISKRENWFNPSSSPSLTIK